MSKEERVDQQLSQKRSPSRFRIFVLYPLLSLALLIVLSVSWLSARNAAAKRSIDQMLKEMQAQGQPYDDASLAAYYERLTSTADLDRWLGILSATSADDFKAASRSLYPWDGTPAPVPGNEWPEHARAQKFLEQWRELLAEAERLAQADIKRRTPVNFDGINTLLEWSEKTRQLSRLFENQAAEAIYRRDSGQTRRAVLSILGTARSVEGQPMIVGQLVTIAIEGLALEQLQHAIEHDVLNAEDLKILQDRLTARSPWQSLWKVGVMGDRALLLPAFNEPERYMAADVRAKLPWRGRDQLTFLKINRRSLDLPSEDLNVFRSASRDLEREVDSTFRGASWVAVFDNFLCNFLLPAHGAYGEAIVQREMHFRLALLAIGVRQYEDKFGKMPAALADLKQVGTDPDQLKPVGSKPFGFRKQDDAVQLWGFQSRTSESTPDQPPDPTESNSSWDRMWLWQLKLHPAQ